MNQCDWCVSWLPLNEYGNHVDQNPWGLFKCSKIRYELHYEDRYNNQYQELQTRFREERNREHIYETWYSIEDWEEFEKEYFIERCDENNYTPLFD